MDKSKIKTELHDLLIENNISTRGRTNHEINQQALQAIHKKKTDQSVQEIEDPIKEQNLNVFICKCGFEVTVESDTIKNLKMCSKCSSNI